MASYINDLLAITAASKNVKLPDPARFGLLAQHQMDSGINQLKEMGKGIMQERINSDVAAVLGSVPETSDPEMYQKQLFDGISKIDGVSAVDALGLATTLAKPAFDARAYVDDRIDAMNLNHYRDVMSGRGSYGMTVDDYGNAYRLNKYTGAYEKVQSGTTGVNPKNVTLKTVVSRDANGVERTLQVPYNKLTGQPVDNFDFSGPSGGYERPDGTRVDASGNEIGIKYPKPVQANKDKKDSLEATMSLVDGITLPTERQSGPIDSRLDDAAAWLNIDTKDAVAAKAFDAEVANLTTAFGTAQVKGVLSDKDTKYIADQMPSRSYSPEVNRQRINSIKKKLREAAERYNKANPLDPIHLGNPNTPLTNANAKGSKYGPDTEIISF